MVFMQLTHNAGQLKATFDVLKDLLTDVNLIFHADGLKIVAVDPEKIVAVTLHLDSLFEYTFSGNGPFFFGVHIPTFYKILKTVDGNQVLRMEIDEKLPNIMKLTISHLTKEFTSMTSLYGLDLPKDELLVPLEQIYEATASINTKDLLRTIKDMSHGTKHITISSSQDQNPQYLTFSTKGDVYSFTTSISLCPNVDGLEWKSFETDKVQGKYMIKYIEKFLKTQVSPKIEMSFNKESFLLLSYKSFPMGTFNMTIAPIEQITV